MGKGTQSEEGKQCSRLYESLHLTSWMKYIVVDLKAGNLFVNQNGVKNRVACMAPTGKKKTKQNKTKQR